MSKKNKNNEPQFYLSRINTQVLNYNVYVMSAWEKLLYMMLLALAGGVVGLIFYSGLFKVDGEATALTFLSNAAVFALGGVLANKYFLSSINETLKNKRKEKLRKQFCEFASSLTNSLASGMNMTSALEAVYTDLKSQYSEDALIVVEVAEILNGINNNIPIENMLEDFGARSGVDDILNFGKVFATCYRTGGDIKSVVRRTTEIISEKMMISSEIQTAITSNKMQMNIMIFIPIVIVLMMRLMSKDFAQSFSTIVGVGGLSVTAGLTIGAYKLGQKIMDIKG